MTNTLNRPYPSRALEERVREGQAAGGDELSADSKRPTVTTCSRRRADERSEFDVDVRVGVVHAWRSPDETRT